MFWFSAPRELLKPLGQFGAKDGQHPSAPGPARGDRAGDTQSWENAALGAPRTQGRTGGTQSRGHSEFGEPAGLH